MKYLFLILTSFVFISGSLIGSEQQSNQNTSTVLSEVMNIVSYDISEQSTTIILNNGTRWSFQDTYLFTQPGGWDIGDRIQIVYIHRQGYFLQNLSYNGCVSADLINSSSQDIFSHTIQSIMIGDKESNHLVTLEDGSVWFVGTWSSAWMRDWKAGDRVLVTPHDFLFGNAEHLIINLDSTLINDRSLCSNVRAQIMNPQEIEQPADLNQREGRQWKMTITKVTQENFAMQIELDNKMQLGTTKFPKKIWKEGETVILNMTVLKNYNVINQTNNESIDFRWLNFESSDVRTQKIVLLFNKSKKAVLDDGSVWSLRSRKKSWHEGDRVLVSPLDEVTFDTCSHSIINLEAENHISATLER